MCMPCAVRMAIGPTGLTNQHEDVENKQYGCVRTAATLGFLVADDFEAPVVTDVQEKIVCKARKCVTIR